MTTATELTTLLGAAKGGVLTLDPPGKEFQGPLVIRRPVTINGQGGTIWAEKGPVVVIESAGVVLNELNVEVTGTEDQLAGEEACAIVSRTNAPTLTRVAVRGHVVGIPGEEGEWRYPRIVRLNRVKAGTTHTFTLRLLVPVSCRIDSMVSGIAVAPTDLRAGEVEVAVRVESMSEGIRLRGLLRLTTGRLTRRIELSGHVSADGPGVTTGTGQVLFEPADWSGTAAAAPPVPPPAPTPTAPPVATPPPVPTAATKRPMPPPVQAPAPPPTPTPPPVPATPAAELKPKGKWRFGAGTGGAFSPPPAPAEPPESQEPPEGAEVVAEEVPDDVPEPPPPPMPEPPPSSDPLKPKTGMRRPNKPGGAFGT